MARRKIKASTGLQNPKAKINITITPESKANLEKISSEMGLTKSDFFEGILNGSINLSSPKEKTPKTPINQEQIEAQKEKISVLEKEITEKENVLKETEQLHQSLQQKLDNQISIVAKLETELKQIKTTSKDTSKAAELQNLVNSKNATIKQLNEEIKQLKEERADSKGQDISSSERLTDLQQQINLKNNSIAELKQQIALQQQQIQELQAKVIPVTVTKPTKTNLEYLNQQQKDTITRLEKRIAELQTVASIGSQTLNKWRSKMYR